MEVSIKCKTPYELLYKWFVIRLNSNIPKRELKVLISWIFNKGSRKDMVEELNIAANTLNVYLYELKKKGIFLNVDGRYKLNPTLKVPTNFTDTEITFKFTYEANAT